MIIMTVFFLYKLILIRFITIILILIMIMIMIKIMKLCRFNISIVEFYGVVQTIFDFILN